MTHSVTRHATLFMNPLYDREWSMGGVRILFWDIQAVPLDTEPPPKQQMDRRVSSNGGEDESWTTGLRSGEGRVIGDILRSRI